MARGYSLGAFVKEVYNLVYPVGICIDFDNATNPNTAFPGTTWTQIVDGRAVRAATNSAVGTTAGQIGSTGGSDNISLNVQQMPNHNHGMDHDHGTCSAASGGTHTHTVTGTVQSGGAHTHSVSGTAASAGEHAHNIGGTFKPNGSGGPVAGGGKDGSYQTTLSGAHSHSISGTAASAGGHGHTFSGGSAASAGAHTHTVTVPKFTGTVTGNGNNAPIDIRNPFHYYARWKRTA